MSVLRVVGLQLSVRRPWLGVALAAGLVANSVPAFAGVSYRVTPIASGFSATDINDAGWVAGITHWISVQRASLWSPDSGLQDLGQLYGSATNSMALSVNNGNRVVGMEFSQLTHAPRYDLRSGDQAFQWSHDAGMQYLMPENPAGSIAAAINDQNQIAGTANLGGRSLAIRTSPDGDQRFLGTLTGGSDYGGWTGFSVAVDINADGDVVGASQAVDGGNHAFLWTEVEGMQDIGYLPGPYRTSFANGINDARQVVGWSQGNDCRCAFLWSPTDGMQSLGYLPSAAEGYESSSASDINDAGQVVGWSHAGKISHAILWSESAGMQDLNDLIDPLAGWVLSGASGINDKGQIVGVGQYRGQSYGFLLTPVPEPASWAMMLGGVCLLLRCRERLSSKPQN